MTFVRTEQPEDSRELLGYQQITVDEKYVWFANGHFHVEVTRIGKSGISVGSECLCDIEEDVKNGFLKEGK